MFSPLRGFPESTKQEIEIDGKGNYGKGVRYVDSYHCTVLITFLYVKIFIKMLGVGKKKKKSRPETGEEPRENSEEQHHFETKLGKRLCGKAG